MQTRLKNQEMKTIKFKRGFIHSLIVDCISVSKESSRGVSLMWSDKLEVTINSFSLNHISGVVKDDEEEEPWFFFDIYGFPKKQNKMKTWILVQQLHPECGGKWIFFGDFNDITEESEKL